MQTPATTMEKTCPHHGPYTGKVRQWGTVRVEPVCPMCLEEKNAEKEKRDQRSRELASISAQTQIAQHFKQAGIPTRFQDRTFEGYEVINDCQAKALSTAEGYAKRFSEAKSIGACLCFTGSPGTGKTHLATAIGNHVIRSGHTALFITAYKAVGTIKNTWRKGSETNEMQAIESFLKPDLLILDEIGVQFGSETERIMLFNIINGRYEKMLPTVILTNLSYPELVECLGARTVDRLRENGGSLINFNWESYRR